MGYRWPGGGGGGGPGGGGGGGGGVAVPPRGQVMYREVFSPSCCSTTPFHFVFTKT